MKAENMVWQWEVWSGQCDTSLVINAAHTIARLTDSPFNRLKLLHLSNFVAHAGLNCTNNAICCYTHVLIKFSALKDIRLQRGHTA